MIDTMRYVAKSVYPAETGTIVHVFEYWDRYGNLLQEAVPIEDAYNLQPRISGVFTQWPSSWKIVGSGTVMRMTSSKWHTTIVDVEWIRIAESPRNNFKTWRWYQTIIRVWLFRHINLPILNAWHSWRMDRS